MNNSRTPKIVVGVGLAAVYAAGLSFYMLRGGQENSVAAIPADAPVASIAATPEPAPFTAPSIAPSLADGSVESASPVPAANPVVSEDGQASVRHRDPVRAEQPVNPPTDVPAPATAVVAGSDGEIPRADGATALVGEEPAESEAIVTSSDEEGDEAAASGSEGSAELEPPVMPGPDGSVDSN